MGQRQCCERSTLAAPGRGHDNATSRLALTDTQAEHQIGKRLAKTTVLLGEIQRLAKRERNMRISSRFC